MGRSVVRLLVLLFVLAPATAGAQIAFDSAEDGGNNGGSTTSLTFSHTCNSCTLLTVHCAGDTVTGSDDLTSVTYNSVATSLAQKGTDATGDRFAYQYHLESPPSGTHNVVVTASTAHYLLCGAVSYTGTATSSQPANASATTGTPSGVTVSITASASTSWIVVTWENYNGNSAPTSGSLNRRAFDGTFGTWAAFDTAGTVLTVGTNAFSMANAGGSSTNAQGLAAEYTKAGAAPSASPCKVRALLGIGCAGD